MQQREAQTKEGQPPVEHSPAVGNQAWADEYKKATEGRGRAFSGHLQISWTFGPHKKACRVHPFFVLLLGECKSMHVSDAAVGLYMCNKRRHKAFRRSPESKAIDGNTQKSEK